MYINITIVIHNVLYVFISFWSFPTITRFTCRINGTKTDHFCGILIEAGPQTSCSRPLIWFWGGWIYTSSKDGQVIPNLKLTTIVNYHTQEVCTLKGREGGRERERERGGKEHPSCIYLSPSLLIFLQFPTDSGSFCSSLCWSSRNTSWVQLPISIVKEDWQYLTQPYYVTPPPPPYKIT